MMKEEVKMYGFRLNLLDQQIFDNYLINNNISNTKELIDKFIINRVKQEAYNNIQAKKQLK